MSSPPGFGNPLHVVEVVDSTQVMARSLAKVGAEEGTAVLSGSQLAGKGRGERTWFSPPGGLWFSLVLRPPPQAAQSLAALTLLGVLAALESLPASDPESTSPPGPDGFHWPNDIIRRGKKMGGVLAEAQWSGSAPEFVILGMGVNLTIPQELFPEELRGTAISLQDTNDPVPEPRLLFRRIMTRIQHWYGILLEKGSEPLITVLTPHCLTLGRRVRVETEAAIEGKAEALTANGALVIRADDGKIHEFWSANRVVIID